VKIIADAEVAEIKGIDIVVIEELTIVEVVAIPMLME
jgi:hypothetical protein